MILGGGGYPGGRVSEGRVSGAGFPGGIGWGGGRASGIDTGPEIPSPETTKAGGPHPTRMLSCLIGLRKNPSMETECSPTGVAKC